MTVPARSSKVARYALVLYVVLDVYASLYPLTGWTYRGISPWAFVTAGLPRYLPYSDFVLNILAYGPLGFLLVAALLPRLANLQAVLTATLAASTISFLMEALQTFLPGRVSTSMDWALNTLGALVGASVAALYLPRLRAADALYTLRHRWFSADASFGLLLLALWPLAQLYPQPVPFGNGNLIGVLMDWAAQQPAPLLGSSPGGLAAWLAGWQPGGLSEPQQQVLPVLACALIGALTAALAQARAPRSAACLGVLGAGVAATTLSVAMSYGPDHAFTWLHAVNLGLLATGVVLALLLCRLPPRWAAVAALAIVLLMLGLVNRLPDDPYYALNLQAWQQGRWFRFYGLAQWLGLAWPYVTAAYLAKRAAGLPSKIT